MTEPVWNSWDDPRYLKALMEHQQEKRRCELDEARTYARTLSDKAFRAMMEVLQHLPEDHPWQIIGPEEELRRKQING